MISPPSRLKSVRRSRRFWAFRSGSCSFQNRCPPRLPGMTVNASAAEAIRGNLPVASNSPPPTWTAAFIRAAVSGFDGILLPTGSGRVRNVATVGLRRIEGGLGVAQGINTLANEYRGQQGTGDSAKQHGRCVPGLPAVQTGPAHRRAHTGGWGCFMSHPQRQHHPKTDQSRHRANPGNGARRRTGHRAENDHALLR